MPSVPHARIGTPPLYYTVVLMEIFKQGTPCRRHLLQRSILDVEGVLRARRDAACSPTQIPQSVQSLFPRCCRF